MDFMYTPTIEELDTNIIGEAANKPIAKKKNEKRKANESVIGDSRFKIDTSRGIVIY
jgi:hypothetical protein